MPNNSKDSLFQLIKSLTPAEKRFFKIDAMRLASSESANFIKLFDLLSKQKVYNEERILQHNFIKNSQLSNLKNHLYKKILNSLRNIPSQQTTDIILRDDLNNAMILYNKGLYQQSLSILARAKDIAEKYDEHALNFEINKLEKIIESQYITRSEKNRASELIQNSNVLLERTLIENKLTNLTLWLYNYLLKKGYCTNKVEVENIHAKVKNQLAGIEIRKLGFIEKLWWLKVKVWESLVTRSRNVQEYAKLWVELFIENKRMLQFHPVWYIRGNNYLLQACFHNRDIKNFDFYYNLFMKEINHSDFPTNPNIVNLIFIYKNTAILNKALLHNDFGNTEIWNSIITKTKDFEKVIDDHHINILRFKIAALYFLHSDFESSKTAASEILNTNFDSEKDEIYFFAQILLLMNFYESANDNDVEEVFGRLNILIKKKSLYMPQHRKLVEMFEDIFLASPLEKKKIFEKNLKALKIFKQNKNFQRSLSYLDLENWFLSHILNTSVADLIKKKG